MNNITSELLQLLQCEQAPKLTQPSIFRTYNELNASLKSQLKGIDYLSALTSAEQNHKCNELSELVSQVSKHLNAQPPHSPFEKSIFEKQQNYLLFSVEIIEQNLEKLSAIKIVDQPIQLSSYDDSVEITAQAMQLQEEPMANMYEINGIIRDVYNTQKVTNAAIKMQGETMWRIESGVDQANTNMDSANEKFLSALKNSKSYWKCIFMLFLVIFLYLVVKAILKKL